MSFSPKNALFELFDRGRMTKGITIYDKWIFVKIVNTKEAWVFLKYNNDLKNILFYSNLNIAYFYSLKIFALIA